MSASGSKGNAPGSAVEPNGANDHQLHAKGAPDWRPETLGGDFTLESEALRRINTCRSAIGSFGWVLTYIIQATCATIGFLIPPAPLRVLTDSLRFTAGWPG